MNFFASPLRRARTVSSTATSLTYPTTPLAEPTLIQGTLATDRWVIDIAPGGGGKVPYGIKFFPFGTGSADDAFTLTFVGWEKTFPVLSDARIQWIPTPLATVDCTLGTYTGIASGNVIDTEKFCDTVVFTKQQLLSGEVSPTGTEITFSPADNTIGWAIVKLMGCERLEIIKSNKTNTPTGNWLYTLLSRY